MLEGRKVRGRGQTDLSALTMPPKKGLAMDLGGSYKGIGFSWRPAPECHSPVKAKRPSMVPERVRCEFFEDFFPLNLDRA